MRTRVKVGDRVGAVLGAKNGSKTINVFGFGVYEGDFVPEHRGEKSFATYLHEHQLPNPRIRLDSGEVVYGAECWWGPEEQMQKRLAGHEAEGFAIETVNVAEAIGLNERETE